MTSLRSPARRFIFALHLMGSGLGHIIGDAIYRTLHIKVRNHPESTRTGFAAPVQTFSFRTLKAFFGMARHQNTFALCEKMPHQVCNGVSFCQYPGGPCTRTALYCSIRCAISSCSLLASLESKNIDTFTAKQLQAVPQWILRHHLLVKSIFSTAYNVRDRRRNKPGLLDVLDNFFR